MKEITGELKMLGSNATTINSIGKSFIKYNSIEIGDTILQNIRTAKSLDDFVSRGIGEQVTLFLNGKFLMGVKLSNGKVYYWKRSIATLVFVLLSTLIFGAMLGGGTGHMVMGLLAVGAFNFLCFKNDILQILSYQPKMSRLGGIPLKS